MHLLIPKSTVNQIYGFIAVNISNYKRYPITSEDFWFIGYKGPDPGEIAWESIHAGWISSHKFNITHVVENRKCKGNIHWHHGTYPLELLQFASEKDCVYNCGNIYIWQI